MGLKIPEDIDGRILKELINDEYLHNNTVKYCPPEMYKPDETITLLTEEGEEIRKQLKSLGYIE